MLQNLQILTRPVCSFDQHGRLFGDRYGGTCVGFVNLDADSGATGGEGLGRCQSLIGHTGWLLYF